MSNDERVMCKISAVFTDLEVPSVLSLEGQGLGFALSETAASDKIFDATIRAFEAASLEQGSTPKASLIYSAVTKLPAGVAQSHKDYLYSAIGNGKIQNNGQLEAAMEFINKNQSNGTGTSAPEVVAADFDEFCGVGKTVAEADLVRVVQEVLTDVQADVVAKRYRYNTGLLLKAARAKLRFVDGKLFVPIIDAQLAALLGPKTEEDLQPLTKAKKKKDKKAAAAANADAKGHADTAKAGSSSVTPNEVEEDPFQGIPSVFDGRSLQSAINSPELVEKQKLASGGKVVCRFPPEPNGYLHIGHAKAMLLDFGYAKKMDGYCILRFDDTNPEVENEEYIESILDMVKWMGHEPWRVTYSSDYFPELFELGKELIRRDKAFVCHQTKTEMSEYRAQGRQEDSPWRNRPIEESLREFDDMRKGKYEEGEATLRMKIDMKHWNANMRDPVAYRVKHVPHPKTGDQWCVYPTYDFTHCLVDSLEWVTHSLCTLEFETRRDSYYWLLEALDLYRPYVWECARLNLEYTIMSKRKLLKLVQLGKVRGWDDLRLPTLVAMRRRGVPPEALNKFAARVGFSRAINTTSLHVLEHAIRAELDPTVVRAKAVLRPLKVVIQNFDEGREEVLTVPNHPTDPSLGSHEQTLRRTVYIERSDFRMVDEKGFYGLAPGKTAMLRHAYPIRVDNVVTSDDGEPRELEVTYDPQKSTKPKGVLHWVAGGDESISVEVRMYEHLFKSSFEEETKLDGDASVDPEELEAKAETTASDGWLKQLNPDSEIVYPDALVERFVSSAKPGDRFQFERVGFFVCDTDSTPDKLVFSLIVSLKDSSTKQAHPSR